MGTTPTYSWPYPEPTDPVANGAQDIEDLALAVETTVTGLSEGGLILISRTTVGSAVSSVTVSGAFSTDYDNYRIIVEGGAASSALTSLQLTLGATATGYYWAFIYGLWGGASPALARGSNSSSWALYGADTNGYSAALDILGPYLADQTSFHGSSTQSNTGGTARTGHVAGFLNNTTSYTDFTLTISTGTITGGTIDVYGYAKA
jgi:hypothetical protein